MTQYIGIDVHKKTSQIAVLDGTRETFILEKSIRSWPRRFKEVLEDLAPAPVLIEASTVSRWVAPYLRTLGFEVIVGDPNFALMYASRSSICKNDQHDARALAFALKNGHYRGIYEPNVEQQAVAEFLGTRASQVRRRTAVINRTRALYAARGEEVKSCGAESFRQSVRALPMQVAAARPLLEELSMLEDTLGHSDKELAALAASHPVASRLMSVPGVGPIVALSFVVKIGDPTRFRTARQVESYLGLVPTIHASAQAGQGYRISKRGPGELRALLTEAAWNTVGSNDPKALPIKEWFHRLEQRHGAGKAIIAVARRLAGILYALWRDNSTFELREPRPMPPPEKKPRARRYQLNKAPSQAA
jgi:transposase